jgi:aminoglycoside 6'-N-acetyltransferase I
MNISIREMGAADRAAWAEMRGALWPEETAQEHATGIDEIVGLNDAWGFIAETVDGTPVGFAELAIRKYANGCTARPVPFLEGIWVRAEFRRRGIGARLIAHVGAFAADRGFREIGSDTEIENRTSHAAHRSWGFSETERVVYFRKALNASSADSQPPGGLMSKP